MGLPNTEEEILLTKSQNDGEFEDGDEKISRKYENFEEILKLYYHPVHFGEEDSSPTALVPFCQFGQDMDRTGRNSSYFDIPVCNIFTEKIVNHQLCYQVDINRFQHNQPEHIRRRNLRDGLLLIIDVNEEYQTEDLRNLTLDLTRDEKVNLKTNYVDVEEEHHFRIYIETISKIFPSRTLSSLTIPDSIPLRITGPGHYGLTNIKQVRVTEELLGMDMEDRKCQNSSLPLDCLTKQRLDLASSRCQCVPIGLQAQSLAQVGLQSPLLLTSLYSVLPGA